MDWKPILDEELAQSARRAIAEIAKTLEEHSPERNTTGRDYSLTRGTSGLALFYAHLTEFHPTLVNHSLALKLIEKSIEAVGESRMQPDLFLGIFGIGWSAHHISRLLKVPTEPDYLEELDQVLVLVLEDSWQRVLDLSGGLIGVGV